MVVLLVLATFGCDQVTKQVARQALDGSPRQSCLGDTLRLEYSENRGAFLGLGAEWPTAVHTAVLVVGSLAALVSLSIAVLRLRWSGLTLAGALLTVSGGSSNLFDRVVNGSVVDFLNLGVGSIRTGIFNVADVALIFGLTLIVGGTVGRRHRTEDPSRRERAAGQTSRRE